MENGCHIEFSLDDRIVKIGFMRGGIMEVVSLNKNLLGKVAIVCLAFISTIVSYTNPLFGNEPKFQGLGDLPGGIYFSKAFGVSPDGSVVVGQSNSGNGMEAFVWTPSEGMVGLGDFDKKQVLSLATGVSANGTVVGRGRLLNHTQAFRWTQEKGLSDLGGMEAAPVSTEALDISANGRVIVGNILGENTNDRQAFLWTQQAGLKEFGDLPGGEKVSFAYAIASDGQVVVGRSKSAHGIEAFYWTEEKGMMALGDLPGGEFFSAALGISSDGKVVVGFGTTRTGAQAFRWTKPIGLVWLGEVPGVKAGSAAFDASKDGSIIVGTITYGEAGDEAFIWDSKSGFQHLESVLEKKYVLGNELKGWTLEQALSVSDDGSTIVGFGVNPEGKREGWIVRIKNPLDDLEHKKLDIQDISQDSGIAEYGN